MEEQFGIDADGAITDWQRFIDSGAWLQMEGSLGRAAEAAIHDGLAMLPPNRQRTYWGQTIPSRDDVSPGTPGSKEYMEEAMKNREVATAFVAGKSAKVLNMSSVVEQDGSTTLKSYQTTVAHRTPDGRVVVDGQHYSSSTTHQVSGLFGALAMAGYQCTIQGLSFDEAYPDGNPGRSYWWGGRFEEGCADLSVWNPASEG